MHEAMFRTYLRVIERRYNNGENIDDILFEYTKLSDVEREEIRNIIISTTSNIEQEINETNINNIVETT